MTTRIDPPALPGLEPLFDAVRDEATAWGTRAMVVGGYVRDRLLGGERQRGIKEVDFLVEGGGGLEVARGVARRLGLREPVVFERFGTAHLALDRMAAEFVSARAERYDPNSRKPEVRAGSLEDDVRRRDFTINALLMDWDGTVLDLTGRGLRDLSARRIVTPLDPRDTFDEDPLRMLRAVRFAATLRFDLDPLVLEALQQFAHRLTPPVVSMERINEEFSRLLQAADVERGLQVLDSTGLLKRILPQLESGKGMEQGNWHSHDVFGHNLLTAALTRPELVTRLAGLLHDVGKPATYERKDGKITFLGHQEVGAQVAGDALKRLRYSGETIERVQHLIRLHMRPVQYDPQAWEDRAVRRLVRDAGPDLDQLLDLARADMRASRYPEWTKIDDLERRIKSLDTAAIAGTRSPLTGNDLMTRTGRPPGPWIKRVKAALEDAIIDGTITADADAAWRFLDQRPELLGD